jgi:hypothetical protein
MSRPTTDLSGAATETEIVATGLSAESALVFVETAGSMTA